MQASAENGFHVALNAHLLSGQDTYRSAGVHQYILHLLRYVGDVEEGVRVTGMLGASAPNLGADVQLIRSKQDTRQPTRRVLWEQFAQPRILRQIGADLVHGPAFVGPLAAPCAVVITIHDLSFLRFPRLFRPVNRVYLRTMTRLSARRCKRLIAVSEHAARESAELLGVPRDKVSVVYHGIDPAFQPLRRDQVAAFRDQRGLPERFFLFVGTLEPRKNLVRLIDAFARTRDGKAKLVLVGGKGWLYQDLFSRVEELGLGDDVVFPGYVPNGDLPLWYNAATAFVYPSLYEGFGMPVTEAQACGTPVITSNTSSLPEAAGDGAIQVDPTDVGAIASALESVLGDRMLREELRRRGLAHAQSFTWDRSARETVEVYRKAVSSAAGGLD